VSAPDALDLAIEADVRPLTSLPRPSHHGLLVFCYSRTTSRWERWMRPLFCAGGVLGVFLMAGLVAVTAGASSDDETPSIKKVMQTLHKGKTSPLNTVKAALKTESPDWTKVQKEAKLFATYGAALPKNDPPLGDKASFEKLAKAYASSAEALESSAKKEDLKGSRDAFKKISNLCMPCHKDHRPN
jgi:cytochrome c556